MKFQSVHILLFFLLCTAIKAQPTNPEPNQLPYFQDFSTLEHSSATFPSGWQGWKVGSSALSSFRTSLPVSDLTLNSNASASTTSGGVHNYDGKIGLLQTGSMDPGICVSLITTGRTDITVKYDIMTMRNPYNASNNTRINEITLQYRIDTVSEFVSFVGIEYQNDTLLNSGSGNTVPQNSVSKTIQLPLECENQSVVQLRWVARDISGSGSRPSFALDNISVFDCFTLSLNPVMCSSDSLEPLISGGAPPFSYLWSSGDTSSFITDLQAKNYFVYVEDKNGCLGIDSIALIINDILLQSPLGSDSMLICKNGGYTFVPTINKEAYPVSFQWYHNNQPVSSDSIFHASDEGAYYLALQNVCGQHISSVVNLAETPNRASMVLSDKSLCYDLTIKKRPPVRMEDSLYSAYGVGQLYKWYKKNITSGVFELIAKGNDMYYYNAKRSGRYYFRVFNSNCANSTRSHSFYINRISCVKGGLLIIDENEDNYSLETDDAAISASESEEVITDIYNTPDVGAIEVFVFPNPFSTDLRIEILSENQIDFTISLYDVLGRKSVCHPITSQATTIALSELVNGLYNYKLTNSSGELVSSGNLVKR